ncbi:uncharacterized protein LOC127878257 [Dreissena polymorpha]|uniref:uncharacterized protein LOC127878257 n=1 Tax=Dreissena polymorpha TaxID=45954 RepID=UPI0022648FD2|nr:uncharacterized protein LOC127878257 [Dreissena polymorpha]
MLEASEDPALLPRFDISHDFGLSVVSASDDIALNRTSEFEPFDLTRAEVQPPVVIDERNLPEPAVSDSVLTQPETIEYTVVDAGTKRGKPKLVSSDGYSFTFKLKTAAVVDVFAAYVNLDEQLGQLWEEYDQRELTTEDFLTKIGETYAF